MKAENLSKTRVGEYHSSLGLETSMRIEIEVDELRSQSANY